MKPAVEYLLAQCQKLHCLKQSPRGEVWMALDQAERPVIYKCLHRTGLALTHLKDIHHPLWPRIYAVAEDEDGTTHVLEEYVQGEPMSRRIETQQWLKEDEAKDILIQLASGLSILHAHHILHRDIKPGNLTEQPGGITRLIDFDAAREMGEDKEADTVYLGTKGYAPPEQYGYGQTDARILSLNIKGIDDFTTYSVRMSFEFYPQPQ